MVGWKLFTSPYWFEWVETRESNYFPLHPESTTTWVMAAAPAAHSGKSARRGVFR